MAGELTESSKSSYWDIIAAGVAAYFANKGTSGGTPNQYPTVLPPEVKRVADEAWNVYKAGGSPAQQDVRSAGTQFLAGMPTTAPNFSFTSNALKGGTFAGGVTLPKIDVSKFSGGGSGINANALPPKTPTGTIPSNVEKFPNASLTRSAGGPTGFGRKQDDLGWSREDESIGNFMGRNPSVSSRDISGSLGEFDPQLPPGAIGSTGNTPGQFDPAIFGRVKDAFNQWRQANPNWAALGPKAFFGWATGGPAGALAGIAVGSIEAAIRALFAPPKPVDSTGGKAPAPLIPKTPTNAAGGKL